MKARTNFSVINGVTSHAKDYVDRFFFVRIDGESVEEGFLHLFPTDWLYQRGKIVASPFLESEKRVLNVCVFFFFFFFFFLFREQVSHACSFRSFDHERHF